MRLKVSQQTANTHKDMATSLGWTPSNELFTASDDKTVWKWNVDGEPLDQVCALDVFITDFDWFPTRRGAGNEFFVVGCTDGSFKMVSKMGRVEKNVDKAHTGAVTCVRWNYEGTSLLTAGEDGVLKIWSKNGMPRSTLLQIGVCIYSVCWSPNNDSILLTVGKDLVIKPLQPTSKQLQWPAHDSTVLKVDWNPVNNLIVSGGEDCKYKIWDSYGRPLYQSKPFDNVITSVSWCPNGELFAVGSYNNIRLCDKTGWSYSRERTQTGSIFNIAWASDGTQLAGVGGSGSVCFGHLVDRRLEWQNVVVNLDEDNHIHVADVNSEAVEDLTFREKVIKMSLSFNHLIVATASQCHIYNVSTWGTPVAFDLKDTANLIVQCEKYFLTVDNFSGLQVYNYEGRIISTPKYGGLRTEFMSNQSISMSNDFLAILDRIDRKIIHVVETSSGKASETTIQHTQEIIEVFINQYGHSSQRKVAFIDKNHDLYLSPILKPKPTKIASMVNSALWSDKTDMLSAIMDGRLVVWMYPNAVFFDKDLTNLTRFTKDTSLEFGKNPQILHFLGKTCTVRRTDGTVVATPVSPYPLLLYEYRDKNDWESCVRLCRFVQDQELWACLGAMSIDGNELNTAEVAFAAIEEVDKLQFIAHIKEIPSVEGKNAELYLYKGLFKEAESVLLQAGLTYRAIKMNIRMFRWDRALELATRHKTHIDTVVAYRNKYLQNFNKSENNEQFLKLAETIEIDWEKIKAKIAQEKEKEQKKN